MRKLLIFLSALLMVLPLSLAEAKPKKSKKKYYTYKTKRYKKKRRVKIRRYPKKANTYQNADRLKLEEMVEDLF